MELIGESNGYNLYRNKDGTIEGYKKTGKRVVNEANIGTGLGHIVTNCNTIEQFETLIAANTKFKPKAVEPPSLFPE